ncbi:hypothetical protein CR532_05210 (plasmid) [Candidatus Borreliella tachyglossi]|uniref:Uncharacterized protein n=1 Tax=Candidatus Borreliella tachyglossi TaxID=1964448 RepID=A0A2S1LYL2_9SPIR|nr:DUF228 domain-containing protein [Candidatus Borreliella tachyglossi]AWG43361.1 hypothetical protein CR532_05020 [Candidatus Borreliella tachyglossi]AWG43396.1 hypothetical protein CR532_05210 [Candidatus Borreliella tachyglossi]
MSKKAKLGLNQEMQQEVHLGHDQQVDLNDQVDLNHEMQPAVNLDPEVDLNRDQVVNLNHEEVDLNPDQPRRRGKRAVQEYQAQEAVARPDEEMYKEYILKLKKYTKNPTIEAGVFSNRVGFKDKFKVFDNSGLTNSSSVDKIEHYPYKGFPYKRGVKIVFSIGDDSLMEPYVTPSKDAELYGICVDVDEFTNTASVLPITNNFEGYLVTRNRSLEIGDLLDFNSQGIIIKAEGDPPTSINAVALSTSFTIDFKEDLGEYEDLKKIDFQVHFVKVAIYGNRGVEVSVPKGVPRVV